MCSTERVAVAPVGSPVRRLLDTAAQHRNSARWAVALALGLRQGEALGLKWEDVDLEKGTLRIRRSLLRPKYEHGRGGDCGRAPGRCPKRRNTRPVTGTVKSKAGRRTVGLPAPLVALLRKRRTEQNAEHTVARQLWRDEGWVFATPTGGPLNHYTDNRDWKRLLREPACGRLGYTTPDTPRQRAAHSRPARRTVMSLMGWSTTGMAKRYQHVTDTVRADVASQVGSLIWEARTEGAANETVTVRRDSLATILKLVEDGLLTHIDADDLDLTELKAALMDLHTAMASHGNDPNGDTK